MRDFFNPQKVAKKQLRDMANSGGEYIQKCIFLDTRTAVALSAQMFYNM
jgi:hypothetical protein